MRDFKSSWLQRASLPYIWLFIFAFLTIGISASICAEVLDGTEPLRLVPIDEEVVENTAPSSALDEPHADSTGDNGNAAGETILITTPMLKEEEGLNNTSDDLGLLDQSVGGLSEQLWQNTRRELIMQLMPRMPIETRSRVIRALSLKLLLSPGRVVFGDNAKEGEVLLLRAKILPSEKPQSGFVLQFLDFFQFLLFFLLLYMCQNQRF